MQSVQYRKWVLEHDPELTRDYYKARKISRRRFRRKYRRCSCENCGNFGLAEPDVYPAEIQHLFLQLGISFGCETELLQLAEPEQNLFEYSGWLPFVGKIKSGPGKLKWHDGPEYEEELITDRFSIGFSEELTFGPERIQGHRVVELVFAAKVPWRLDEPHKPNPRVNSEWKSARPERRA